MPIQRLALAMLAASLFACECGGGVASLDVTLAAEPTTLDFGAVPIGSVNRRAATLVAGSRGTVDVQPAALDRPDAAITLGDVAGALAASASRELAVQWTPTTTDALDNWVTVPSDAAGADVRIHLLGRVVTCTDEDGDGAGIGPACPASDCNDANPSVSPSAPEACNGVDDDCDGRIDEGDVCGLPPEACNGADDNGNGQIDEGGVCPPETCNGVDDDKDGQIDEGGVCETSSETCNGIDDDQNGAVDDVPRLGEPCAAPTVQGPTGLDCTNTGRLACNTATGNLECRAPSGTIDCTASCNGTSLSVRVEPYFRGELPGMVFQNPPGSGYSRPITVTFTPPVPRVAITCVDPDFTGNDAVAFDAQGNQLDRKVFVGDGAPGSQPPNTDLQTLEGQPGRDIARVVLTPDPQDYVGYSAIGVCP